MTHMQPSNPNRTDDAPTGEGRPDLSRRRLIAAGAWTLPAVALAVAAPAASASTPVEVITVTVVAGDVISSDGHSVTFTGVNPGHDTFPLMLAVTKMGAPYSGPVSAQLGGGAAGVASWDSSVDLAGGAAGASASGGSVDFPINVDGTGTFQVAVNVEGTTVVLNVTFQA